MKLRFYATLFVLLFILHGQSQAQCGDNCINATVLTVTATGPCNYVPCTNTSASGATPSSVNPGPCSGVLNNDVWYTFIVPAGVTSLIGQVQGGTPASGAMEYPIVYFYRGGCGVLTNLGCNTGNPPGSTASLLYSGFVPGEQIHVRVKPLGGTSDGTFQICVYNPCPGGPPANDNPCGATTVPMSVSPCNTFTNISLFCATNTPGPPLPGCGNYLGNDIWVQTTVGANGHLAVRFQAQSLFNPAAAIYTGTCSSLTLVACDDDAGGSLMPYIFTTSLPPNSTAWIRIWASGSATNTGTVGLCLFDPCPGGTAPGDDPCSAISVPMTAGTCNTFTSVSNSCASSSSGIPVPGCGFYSGGDVWVQTTVSPAGHVAVSFQTGTLIDPAAAIYTGTCSSLTLVACDDNGGLWPLPYMYVTGLTPGATAWIRIWAAGSTVNTGTIGICINDPCPGGGPPGDDPCSAVPISLSTLPCTTFTPVSNVCAGSSNGVPAPGCANYTGGDVWVTTTSISGRLEVNFQMMTITDVGAAIYTGSCSSLTLAACNDDGGGNLMPYLYFNSGVPNTTYWIRIWAYGGTTVSSGTTSLCVTDPCPGNSLAPPLYDNPLAMCPVPPPANLLPVTNGSCVNYIIMNSLCAASNPSTVPPNVPVPVNCAPGYPAAAFAGWDVWAAVIIPAIPPVAYLDFNTQTGTLYDLDMAVYKVNSPTAANCSTGTAYTLLACDDLNGPGTMPYLHLAYGGANPLQPGDTLFVRMWHYFGGQSGEWGLCVNTTCPGGTIAPPGYNDPPCPAGAQLLPINGGTCVTFQRADIDNCLSPTTSAPSPTCAAWNSSNDLWFVVQMPVGGSGQLDFTFEQGLTLFDPGMSIYSGLPAACGGSGLTQIACDNDGGSNYMPYISLTNPVAPGQYLYIRVWGYGGFYTGTFGICVSDPCPSMPVNDLRCSAISIPLSSTCSFTTHTLYCANNTDNTGLPPPGCGQPNPTSGTGPGRDIWFSFTAPTSGSVIIDTREGTLNNIDMALYRSSSANDCHAGFILVACDDNVGLGEMPYLSLSNLTSGTTYFLRVWEHDNDQDGTFSLCIFNPCPSGAPANDDICNATFIALNNSIIGNNNCARFDQDINSLSAPPPACWTNVPPFNTTASMNTVWYKTVGSSTYTILVTPNTLIRPQVAVYSGMRCNLITSPQLRACDGGLPGGCKSMPNASLIEITGILALDTIFIVVEGVDNAMGTFEIAVYNTLLSGIHAVPFLDCRQAVPVCNSVTTVANPGRSGSGNHCDLGTGFSYKAYESAPGARCLVSGTTVSVGSTVGLSVGMLVTASGGGTFRPGTRVMSIPTDSQFVVSMSPSVALSGSGSIVEGFIDPSYVSASGALSSGTTITVTNTAGLYAGMTVTSAGGTGGNFPPGGTSVISVLSSTQFNVATAPVPAFSGNTVVTGTRYAVDNRFPESNASWYFFSTTNTPGDLEFTITSTSASNYDFVLWELGGAATTPGYFTGLSTANDSTVCSLIQNAASYGLPVRANVSHVSATSTGLSAAFATDPAFSPPVISTSVRTYLLVVMNTEGNSLGFTLDFGSSPIDFTTPTVVWNGGGGTNEWFSAANWGDCAVPQCNVSAIVVGGLSNQPVITSNASVNSLTIQAGSSLTVDSGVTLIVCGNLTNSGVFLMHPKSLVKFAGQTTQEINGNFNGLNKFASVTVEKPVSSPVSLNVNADITGTLRISTNQSVFDATGKYIRLGGDFFNANGMSSFLGQLGTTIELNGTGIQTFSNYGNGGAHPFYINNVIVNQQDALNDYVELNPSSGGTADHSLRIGSTLSLISGKILTNQWEVYSLSSMPSSVTGGNDNSYIEGTHSRNVARSSTSGSPYAFAVGSGGSIEYAGIVKSASGGVTDTLKLRTSFQSWPGTVPHGPVSLECQGADWSIFEAYDHGYWKIDSLYSNGPAIGNYTLNLRPATIVSNNAGSASWSIMKRTPSGTGSWIMDGLCRTSPVYSSAYDVYRDSMNGFSDFAITQYNVAIVGMQEPSGQSFLVYPNATTGPVTLLASPDLAGTDFSVLDVCGKLVQSGRILGETTFLELGRLAPGMYFLKLHTPAGYVVKVLKY